MNRITLLMTACINPKSSHVVRSDANLRLNDYTKAFQFWLNYKSDIIDSIVFIDNSNFNLSSFRKIANSDNKYKRDIEIISTDDNYVPEGISYGYAELQMIEYALKNSQILLESKYFIKVTGRLVFPNLHHLTNFFINKKSYFIIDFRDFNLFKSNKHFALTTLFITEIQFYKNHLVESKILMVQKNIIMEVAYYQILKKLKQSFNPADIILRFPFNVNPRGIAGHSNKSYNSIQRNIAYSIRAIARILMPKIWI